MIRVLNFCCFAVTALACLALYHVSEETRVAKVRLRSVQQQIADQQEALKVLQADWVRVAEPSRIQQLASLKLGMSDEPTRELASFELLPRRGEQKDLQQANAESASHPSGGRLSYASLHAGE